METMFQDKLKDLRKKKGVTQAELAKEIFVSRSLIAKYETGVAFPNRETLEKIALYFNVPISELIEQDEATLVAVDAKDLSEKINVVSLIVVLAIMTIYCIMVFIPFLMGKRYVYPISPGQNHPNRETFFVSIFSGTLEHGNPIGLVSFLLSGGVAILATTSLFSKKRYTPILRLLTYIFFVIDIFVCIAAVVCCISYIS